MTCHSADSNTGLSQNHIVAFACGIELAYIALSFYLDGFFGQWTIMGERYKTGARLALVVLYVLIYRRYFQSRQRPLNVYNQAGLKAGLSMLLLIALGYTNARGETSAWQSTFALSGLAAGIREELFYRGMIQNVLANRLNHLKAIVLTTLIFSLAHVQYLVQGHYQGLAFIALAGLIFANIFSMSGSVTLAACVHGVYDGLLSIEIAPFRLDNNLAFFLLLSLTCYFFYLNKNLFPK